jgi:plastocyanin
MRVRQRSIVGLLCIALLALGACGGNTKVGENIDVNNLKNKGGTRLGEVTTTVAAVTTTPSTTRPVATTRQVTTTVAQAALEIKIKAAAPQFDPAVGQVRSGSTVRWVNTDSQPRSVEGDSGTFASPMIPPGGKWDFKVGAPGTYNYHDGTRPYAVGQLQVV